MTLFNFGGCSSASLEETKGNTDAVGLSTGSNNHKEGTPYPQKENPQAPGLVC